MKISGKSCALIAEFLYLDDDTIRTWYKCYMSGGFDALERFDWKGGKAYLSKIQEAELAGYLAHNSFYSTYNQFAEAILAFFSRTVPKEWPKFRDTVTDNFRIISFQNFRVLE